jgi:hypothetical protein
MDEICKGKPDFTFSGRGPPHLSTLSSVARRREFAPSSDQFARSARLSATKHSGLTRHFDTTLLRARGARGALFGSLRGEERRCARAPPAFLSRTTRPAAAARMDATGEKTGHTANQLQEDIIKALESAKFRLLQQVRRAARVFPGDPIGAHLSGGGRSLPLPLAPTVFLALDATCIGCGASGEKRAAPSNISLVRA